VKDLIPEAFPEFAHDEAIGEAHDAEWHEEEEKVQSQIKDLLALGVRPNLTTFLSTCQQP
jgi:hypothetical protein